MIILNLKNYPESTGNNAIDIVNAIATLISANAKLKDLLVVAPAVYDLHMAANVSSSANVTLAAPHVDAANPGSSTGMVPAANLEQFGIKYSILNHSEHRLTWENLVATMQTAQAAGLKLIVCCESVAEAQALLPYQPFAIAYEDKDLIGSGQSIITGRPEEIKKFIELTKGKTKVIIGAGISSGEDVKAGIAMGAEGFILASAFVKATDRSAKALELVTPFLA